MAGADAHAGDERNRDVVTERGGGTAPTLVVGATGDLGRRIIAELRAAGQPVRALVRPQTTPGNLGRPGIEIVRGDLLDPSSLRGALDGVGAVVTTANDYRQRGSRNGSATADDRGNQNLIDAAADAGVERFVFISILACDKALTVPHLWQKKLTEDYLRASGVPFVSLRPGAFTGGPAQAMFARSVATGRVPAIGDPDVQWTYIHPDDVARCAAMAVSEPRALGHCIDIGTDRPLSLRELAELLQGLLNRQVRLGHRIPLPPLRLAAKMFSPINPWPRDGLAMFSFFQTGEYVADPTTQAELFGPVPTVEDTFNRVLQDLPASTP